MRNISRYKKDSAKKISAINEGDAWGRKSCKSKKNSKRPALTPVEKIKALEITLIAITGVINASTKLILALIVLIGILRYFYH
jgi:hypothetical protein